MVAAVIPLVLMSGCEPFSNGGTKTPSVPDVEQAVGPGYSCAGKPINPRWWEFDINDDDVPDYFYVARCQEDVDSGRGDQLEVFDGQAGRTNPRRLAPHLIHPAQHVKLADGCLMFRGQQVFVANERAGKGTGWRVVRIGTWNAATKRVDMVEPRRLTTIPC